jgi:hypothetical protein
VCPKCGLRDEIVAPITKAPQTSKCACGSDAQRDRQAELGGVQTDWAEPILSDAAGVMPSQVAEARARFPHHEYLNDGRIVFRSRRQRASILRELGYHDNNDFAG